MAIFYWIYLWQTYDSLSQPNKTTERNSEMKEVYEAEWPKKALDEHRLKVKNVQNDSVPDHKRIEAAEYAKAFWDGQIAGVSPTILKTNSEFASNWWELGPRSSGGRILALHRDLNSGSNTLWAGAAGGGLWKCENAGCTNNSTYPIWQLAHKFSKDRCKK